MDNAEARTSEEVHVDRVANHAYGQILLVVLPHATNESGHNGHESAAGFIVHDQVLFSLPLVAEAWRPANLTDLALTSWM
jgi:hypothetical protein